MKPDCLFDLPQEVMDEVMEYAVLHKKGKEEALRDLILKGLRRQTGADLTSRSLAVEILSDPIPTTPEM